MAASAGGSVRELTSCRRDAGHGSWVGHTAGSCRALTRRGRAGGVAGTVGLRLGKKFALEKLVKMLSRTV